MVQYQQLSAYNVNVAWANGITITNPTSAWKFNEGAGATADDLMMLHNLSGVNTPTWATGIVGNCTVLNGTNQYWTTPSHLDFQPGTGDLTFYGWYFHDDAGTGDEAFFSKGTRIDISPSYGIRITADNLVHLHLNVVYPAGIYSSTATFPVGEWAFIWWRRISGVNEVGWTAASAGVIDLTPKISVSNATNLTGGALAFNIGTAATLTQFYWDGKVDITGWKTGYGYSNAELTYLYNKGIGVEEVTNIKLNTEHKKLVSDTNEIANRMDSGLNTHTHTLSATSSAPNITPVAQGSVTNEEKPTATRINNLRTEEVKYHTHTHTYLAVPTTNNPSLTYPTFTDPTVSAQYKIKAIHINELRKNLEDLKNHTHYGCECQCECVCTCTGTCGCTSTCGKHNCHYD
jgi:hypothetical protein